MRLVVTIQEILVTVSEKKKNLIIQVMLSELVIQGTKKNMLYQVQEATGENREKIVHTMRQLSGPKPF
ncbi:hypothetical protein BK278_25030 [Escherichia coli]|nr:hypothetical protein [Escherichia coli]OAL97093.1 hypothetical protein AY603_18980 [Salmonella enterica subsp. enterica]OCS91960.1 hypothetical protein A7B05_08750 [Salmonella enterica subsp. enterica]OCS97954.1 hypothetical protein A7B04_11000 [Salmonella enterica subsp. enterica]OJM06421.1 hypothetical protein BK274_12230 [Escherichia coli]